MAILVNDKTRVLVQGITGKEGSKVALQMKNYGTKVLAGVTPGKGGQEVHGVPVYNTIAEALENHPGIRNFAPFFPKSKKITLSWASEKSKITWNFTF